MKKMACELCGGTDFIKQDGVFVCQSCGTKYSVEEAKRMVNEDEPKTKAKTKAKADANADVTLKLLTVAKNEYDAGNMSNAEKKCDKLLEIEPTNYQALMLKAKAIIKTAGYEREEEAYHFFVLSVKNAPESKQKKQQKDATVFMAQFYTESIITLHDNLIHDINHSGECTGTAKDLIKQVWYFRGKTNELAELFHCDTSTYNDRIFKLLDRDMTEWYNYYQAHAAKNKYYCDLDGVTLLMKLLIDLSEEDSTAIIQRCETVIYFSKIIIKEYKSVVRAWMGFPGDDVREKYFKIIVDCYKKIKELDPKFVIPEEYTETAKVPGIKGCYVATAVYGSYDCPQVWTLRRFRDNTLDETWYGRLFIKTYYAISPTLVRWFGKTNWFKKLWRPFLDNLVNRLQKDGYQSTPYNDKY